MKKLFGIGAAVLMAGAMTVTAFALTPAQESRLESKKEVISQRVEEGRITQETADEAITCITANMENCDGTGAAAIGKEYGIGFGGGNGICDGTGGGTGNRNAGNGEGRGAGEAGGNQGGMGLRDGSCGK